jgi:hypothetical protein
MIESEFQPSFSLDASLPSVLPQLSAVPEESIIPSTFIIPSTVQESEIVIPEPQAEASRKRPRSSTNTTPKKPRSAKARADDKYAKRLEANKKSAQASRERRKALKSELESKLDVLVKENTDISSQLTLLETENKILRGEYTQLQSLIADATARAKGFGPEDAVPLKKNNFLTSAFYYFLYAMYAYQQQKQQQVDMQNLPSFVSVGSN